MFIAKCDFDSLRNVSFYCVVHFSKTLKEKTILYSSVIVVYERPILLVILSILTSNEINLKSITMAVHILIVKYFTNRCGIIFDLD